MAQSNQPNNSTELISLYPKLKFSDLHFAWSFQNVHANKVRRSTLNVHHFGNAMECILFRILHGGISLNN